LEDPPELIDCPERFAKDANTKSTAETAGSRNDAMFAVLDFLDAPVARPA
jgi:hypothetical protein